MVDTNNNGLDVVIEIPKGSRNKYEMDTETGRIYLDRRLFAATSYPADYGYVPDTLAEDDDPLDVLVLVQEPTFPGCYIRVRPLGILWMKDEKGPDAKIICVPTNEREFEHAQDIADISKGLLAEIQHFFDVYKDLEPDKISITKGYEGREAAIAEIKASKKRYLEALA